MNFIKKYKFILLFVVIVAGILASAFYLQPDTAPAYTSAKATPVPSVKATPVPSVVPHATPDLPITPAPGYQEPQASAEPEESPVPSAASSPDYQKPQASSVPEESPVSAATPSPDYQTPEPSVEPEESPVPTSTPSPSSAPEEVYTCTLSVRCDTVLNNVANLNSDKTDLIPENGVIFPETVLEFIPGESVFDVLLRTMKEHRIHFEFVNAPFYGSTYVEGIGNLYEFDCGEISGWMYKVNGIFPNYGCSKYILKSGDKIEWIYTCDLGKDIGGENISQNQ